MARVTTWRSSRWARWLGWTAVFTVGLGGCGASLSWQNHPLWVLGDEIGFLAILLVPAAVAFAIGVRFADWSWVFGVLVANVLLAAIVLSAAIVARDERLVGRVIVYLVLFRYLRPGVVAGGGSRCLVGGAPRPTSSLLGATSVAIRHRR